MDNKNDGLFDINHPTLTMAVTVASSRLCDHALAASMSGLGVCYVTANEASMPGASKVTDRAVVAVIAGNLSEADVDSFKQYIEGFIQDITAGKKKLFEYRSPCPDKSDSSSEEAE